MKQTMTVRLGMKTTVAHLGLFDKRWDETLLISPETGSGEHERGSAKQKGEPVKDGLQDYR